LYYSDEIIDKVRDASDIVSIIGQSVRLKKAGRRYVGLCPFHNEKTPSFSVDPDRQMFYCFGCHKGGNVFTFLQEHDNMTFPEAVQTLADRAGIRLPERQYTPGQKKARDEKMQLLDLNKTAATWFFMQLHQPAGREGLAYLRNRKLTDQTIQSFGLGFAPADSTSLLRYLREKGNSDELIRKSGLMNVDETRGRMYDRFRNRVIFPILDVQNRVIGFGGRVMTDAKPKYLNSPESTIFDKSRNLYGYHVARRTHAGKLILCEGYMDVIAMHQAGFNYAVASLGTALTQQHCEIIRRFTKDVILSYDSDQAGTNAKMRAIPMLRRVGITPTILHLEPHKDPDEFIKAEGKDAFQDRLDHAENAFLFETGIIQKNYRMSDPDEAAEFFDAVALLIASMDDVFKRKGYVKMAAEQYGIDERDLSDRVVKKMEAGQKDDRYRAADTGARYGRSSTGFSGKGSGAGAGAFGASGAGASGSSGAGASGSSGAGGSGSSSAGASGAGAVGTDQNYGASGRQSFDANDEADLQAYLAQEQGEADYYEEPVSEDDYSGYYEQPRADFYEDPSTGDFYQIPKTATRRSKEGSVSEQGLEMSRRLLLSYIARYPSIFVDVKRYLSVDAFGTGLAGTAAGIIYEQMEKSGKVDEAAVVSRFEEPEDQAKAAEIFHTMDMASGDTDRAKAIRETVRKVYEAASPAPDDTRSEFARRIEKKKKVEEIRRMKVNLS